LWDVASPADSKNHQFLGLYLLGLQSALQISRRAACAKSVPESDVFMPLGLALSEKQIPQITENTEKSK
jgi:hypothetical protein